MDEQWRVIAWAPDYEVSDLGRVRRTCKGYRFPAGKLMKGTLSNGYPFVRLKTADSSVFKAVHIIVCEAFHGPRPSPAHEVAHWDGDRQNNAAGNLRWATTAENAADRVRHGRVPAGEAHKRSRLNDASVLQMRARAAAGETLKAMAADYGVTPATVWYVVHRKTWRHV